MSLCKRERTRRACYSTALAAASLVAATAMDGRRVWAVGTGVLSGSPTPCRVTLTAAPSDPPQLQATASGEVTVSQKIGEARPKKAKTK